MRRLLLPCLLFLSLTVFAAAAPMPARAASAPAKPLFTVLSEDFIKGAVYFGEMFSGWYHAVLVYFGGNGNTANATACDVQSDCKGGLACMNVCDGTTCAVWRKACVHGPEEIRIEPKFGACGKDDACAQGTVCTATCPPGVTCTSLAHCLPPRASFGACNADLDCVATCGQQAFPPIGAVGYRAVCRNGGCNCDLEEVDPALPRVRCTDAIRADRNFVCPAGTTSACTPAGGAAIRLTCLTAPEFGGTCYEDASCANVSCPDAGTPFCDPTDQKCRCKAIQQVTLTCKTDAECGDLPCDPTDQKVCRDGTCACAKTTTIEQDVVCKTAADCPATCAAGFNNACVDSKCACQRTTTQPVACTDVSQCGAVSCPAGFDKACVNSVCACTRTVQQQ